MNKEQLFQSLNELEAQLEGIKSASEHVNSVVMADKELVATINQYAHTVNEQVQLLKEMFEGSVLEVANQSKETICQMHNEYSARVDEHVKAVKSIGEEVVSAVREASETGSAYVAKSVQKEAEEGRRILQELSAAMSELKQDMKDQVERVAELKKYNKVLLGMLIFSILFLFSCL